MINVNKKDSLDIEDVIKEFRTKAARNRKKVKRQCPTGRTNLYPFNELLQEAEELEQFAVWFEELIQRRQMCKQAYLKGYKDGIRKVMQNQ